VQALRDHVGEGVFDFVLVNSDLGPAAGIKPEWQVQSVTLPPEASYPGVEFVHAPVVNPNNPLRHDPDRLARALLQLYEDQRTRSLESASNGRVPQEARQ